jgi:hypothetical protein
MTGIRGTAIKIHTGMLRAICTKNPIIGPPDIKPGIIFTDIRDTMAVLIMGDIITPENMSGARFIAATTAGIGRWIPSFSVFQCAEGSRIN